MESMLSEKGKILKVYEGFKFRRDRITERGVAWRCTVKLCKARLFTDDSENEFLEFINGHCHDKSSNIEREKLSNSVKRKAGDLSERPLKIIRKELASAPIKDIENLTKEDLNSAQRAIYRARRSSLPPLPRLISDVHDAVNSVEIRTNKDEEFVSLNDASNNIIIFTTKKNLEFLASSTTILVDGTFAYCTKFFKQLFTVHALSNKHYVPVAFCLLEDKTKASYEKVFRHLVQKCIEIGTTFLPSKVVADFEAAIHGAVTAVWPMTTLVGCRFHLTQSWYRSIQHHGLVKFYKDQTSDVGKWLRWTFGLCLLDPDQVEDAFVNHLMTDLPEEATPYADYLVNNYIEASSHFPPTLWASTDLSERTTNGCEAFHSTLEGMFCSTHPNIFVFITALKDIQTTNYVTMNTKTVRKSRNPKFVKRQKYLNVIQSEFFTKKMTTQQYIKKISYLYFKE